MNKTKDQLALGVFGGFAPSGFFKKNRVRASQLSSMPVRQRYEAATAVQTARLNGLFGRGAPSPLQF